MGGTAHGLIRNVQSDMDMCSSVIPYDIFSYGAVEIICMLNVGQGLQKQAQKLFGTNSDVIYGRN